MSSEPKLTDKQIEAKAKAAINEVISMRKGMAVLRIRPEIRRAFPFGSKATDKEKRIWNETVELACRELEKWPKPLPIEPSDQAG